MRRALAVLLLIGAAAPAASADVPPPRLFVIGDSLAYDNRGYLRQALPRWQIEQDFDFARAPRDTARDLRARARAHPALAPVIHVSSGTGDDPDHPERLRRSIRRVMRVAGQHRCVVWANIWRLRLEEPTFATLNWVLAAEDAERPNLRVIDWHAMVEAHHDWLVDLVHVNAEGNRARADAVAREARACRASARSRPRARSVAGRSMTARLYVTSLSHPSKAAAAMMSYKRLPHRRVNLPAGFHPMLVRAAGFAGRTVPALELDGRHVQGSLEISRALDEAIAERPLFPPEPFARRSVEDAERWGHDELQPLPRRIFRRAAVRDPALRRWVAADVAGVPAPAVVAALTKPVAARRSAEAGGDEATIREDVAASPGCSTTSTRWSAWA